MTAIQKSSRCVAGPALLKYFRKYSLSFLNHNVSMVGPWEWRIDVQTKQLKGSNPIYGTSRRGKQWYSRFERAKGPSIISLVLVLFISMLFSFAQERRFDKKVDISVLASFGNNSVRVVLSTYLCTGHPVDRSLIRTRNDRGPSHEPCGMAPLSSFHEESDWLVRTRCCRPDR